MTAADPIATLLGPLAGAAGRAARRHRLDADDVFQQAVLHACRTRRWYDPARGTPWVWAKYLVRRAVRDLARFHGRCPAAGLTIDPADPDAPTGLEPDVRDAVRAAVAGLPPRLREVVRLRFGLDGCGGRTLAEMADRGGVSRQRVHQQLGPALDRLFGVLADD